MLDKPKQSFVALAAAILTFSTACGGSSDTSSASPYKLGMSQDQSGPCSSVAPGFFGGARTAAAVVNVHGGVNGHKIQLYERDDKGDPAAALGALRDLAQNVGVSAVLGYTCSLVTGAVAPQLKALKVPGIGGGFVLSLINPPQPYIFSGTVESTSQAPVEVAFMTSYLAKQGKPISQQRLAYMTLATPGGSLTGRIIKDEITKVGAQVAAAVSMANTATDTTPQASQVLASRPDGLILFTAPAQTTLFLKDLARGGMSTTLPVINFATASGPADVKAIGQTWNNYYSVAPVHAADDGTSGVYKDLSAQAKNLGADPSLTGFMDMYVSFTVVFEALGRCGYPCAGEKLEAQLEKTNTTAGGLTFGPYVWSSSSHGGITKIATRHWNNQRGAFEYGATVDYNLLPPS